MVSENNQNYNNYTAFETIKFENCDTKDLDAVCGIEVFGYSTPKISEKGAVTTSGTAQRITCGANITNRVGTVVGYISQSSTVTWSDWGFSWTASSKSANMYNIMYGWSNLSGPSPHTGHGVNNAAEYIYTTGTVQYLSLPYLNVQIRTSLNGGTVPGISWHCGASQVYK